MGVVTISAPYGTHGSEIGPALARRLGLPFIDRAIPAAVARKLGCTLDDAQQFDENYDASLWGMVSSLALVPDLGGAGPLAYAALMDEESFRDKTEQVLREFANGTGGVILGRAAALVLAGMPNTLHVRLDAPVAARIATAAQRSGRSEADVRRDLRVTDSARAAYVRHFYQADLSDHKHYDLVLDSTAITIDEAVNQLVSAAKSHGVVSAAVDSPNADSD